MSKKIRKVKGGWALGDVKTKTRSKARSVKASKKVK